MIRSAKLTGAPIGGRLINQSVVGVFPKNMSLTYYLLGFFNSPVSTDLINAINLSTNKPEGESNALFSSFIIFLSFNLRKNA